MGRAVHAWRPDDGRKTTEFEECRGKDPCCSQEQGGKPMRIVCNTNVLVSGILFGGKPREVLRHCSSGKITNFSSPSLLRVIEDVLQRPKFGLSEEQVHGIIRLFRETFSVVRPEIHITVITPAIQTITVSSKPRVQPGLTPLSPATHIFSILPNGTAFRSSPPTCS